MIGVKEDPPGVKTTVMDDGAVDQRLPQSQPRQARATLRSVGVQAVLRFLGVLTPVLWCNRQSVEIPKAFVLQTAMENGAQPHAVSKLSVTLTPQFGSELDRA